MEQVQSESAFNYALFDKSLGSIQVRVELDAADKAEKLADANRSEEETNQLVASIGRETLQEFKKLAEEKGGAPIPPEFSVLIYFTRRYTRETSPFLLLIKSALIGEPAVESDSESESMSGDSL